ncbi:Transient receptor potential cation channel subfamily M member 2 [Trichinella pseudospiralis]|uniref:Transient receptor potential cation channel subfamily M member 2 n=1 Tax=Trichinella pseudospiralis TaxID=6337 RepID=A0A0V1ESR4_TRIPS|nr:Transient receptor potential cation channel subfamily M member 2 [Trichinella pseudospiralis]
MHIFANFYFIFETEELETLDVSKVQYESTLLNQTVQGPACASAKSNLGTVGKILLTEPKIERTEDLDPVDALIVMKQLTSYVNQHMQGKSHYRTTKVNKAEKCNAPESDIHVLEIEIRKTTCKRKDISPAESDKKCKFRTDVEVVDCIWTGRLKGTTVVENQGLICGDGRYNFFMEEDSLCPLLKYDNTEMRRVLISETHLKWDKALFAYAPPDFSAEFEDDFPHDSFVPSAEYLISNCISFCIYNNFRNSFAKFNKMDKTIDRRSMGAPYSIKDGRPLCPAGRTGFQGRGKHPRWGPNFVLAVIVDSLLNLYFNIILEDKENLLMYYQHQQLKHRSQFPQYFYVDNYTKAGIEAKLEEIIIASKPKEASVEEIRALVKAAMQDALLVKQGFTPDARNTDNAWAETIAVQISDPKRQHLGKLHFTSKQRDTVEWRVLDEQAKSDLKKYLEDAMEESSFNEVLEISDKTKAYKKLLTNLIHRVATLYFASGLALVGGLVFGTCAAPAVALLSLHIDLAILAGVLVHKRLSRS